MRQVTVDGERAFAVALAGRLGHGRDMLIDPTSWEWISKTAGTVWPVNATPTGHEYIVSGARTAYAASTDVSLRGKPPKVFLARLVVQDDTRLDGTKAVVYRNGDHLDVRRCNLEVVLFGEHRDYKPTRPPAEVVDGWSERLTVN
ncbi:hypothetical protein [Roseomonas indoligenes]|uniref:Uncharacterized protein n=1 Tax=Roseomonas indoligenes TaxID=2820811 RepID=A0A940S785_9PROT|nr:hypothetical protein [Pararoseomonas indoligenes]MBP0492778.1 hypothetical protein [Pararoseomonas indoligenes]